MLTLANQSPLGLLEVNASDLYVDLPLISFSGTPHTLSVSIVDRVSLPC